MKGKLTGYNIVLIIVLIVSLGLLFLENASAITGHATSGWTYSNVTIAQYLAIQMSSNLTEGINFGTIQTLGVNDYNATHNYNGTSSSTKYFINVSTDSNTAVDFCVEANSGMTSSGGDIIGLGNESYATNLTLSNSTHPSLAMQVSFSTTNTKAATGVPVGNASYWRFWLDAPLGQPTGSYNNTVTFEGVNAGTACS